MIDLNIKRTSEIPISLCYNMDNRDFIKQIPNGFFDLIIDDAPYGINAPKQPMGAAVKKSGLGYSESTSNRIRKGRLNSGGGHMANSKLVNTNINWDDKIPEDEYFQELFRVSKNQIIFGGNYFPLPPTRCIVCWDKLQPWDNFSKWEMAWTSFDYPAKLFRLSNTGGRNHEQKIAPTQKPVKLYSWLLDEFAKPGDKIADLHLGSGSSRIAAFKKGFDFWSTEIDPQQYKDQEERFATAIAAPAFEDLPPHQTTAF